MEDLEPKGKAKRGCQSDCPLETTYTFRVGPVPTDYSPPPSGISWLNEHGIPKDDIRAAYDLAQFRRSEQQSSWIEYTDSQGYQRWVELKLPHFDPTEDPVVETYPRQHHQRKPRKPKPRTMADRMAPSNVTPPVAAVQHIEAVHITTVVGIASPDIHLPNSQELTLVLIILSLVILPLLARRLWSWKFQNKARTKKEADAIFENLCELKPSKLMESNQSVEAKVEEEKEGYEQFKDSDKVSDDEEYVISRSSPIITFKPDSWDEASPASSAANTLTPPAEIIVALSTPPMTPKPRIRLPRSEAYVPESCLPQSIREENQDFKRECIKHQREQEEKMRQSMDSLKPHLATRLRVKRSEQMVAEDDGIEGDPACSYVS